MLVGGALLLRPHGRFVVKARSMLRHYNGNGPWGPGLKTGAGENLGVAGSQAREHGIVLVQDGMREAV